ncbi:MAG: Gfo/Idh/MocA family oxidoreductase [Verrucomicrobiaceae bacterium]
MEISAILPSLNPASATRPVSSLRPVRVAVIGCGYWGPNLIRNFAAAPDARLVAVCDLQPARFAHLQAHHPTVEFTSDYEALLAGDDVDAVAIATPLSTHFPLASRALAAGKHVLVEKPMTATVAEAQELVALAETHRRVLMVNHIFAYNGAVRTIRELAASGQLGELLYYDSVRINLGLFQSDVNVLWDLAVHDLAIMDFALGQEPVAVSATGHAHLRGQHEDVAYLTCFFDTNLIAHLHVNWLAPVKIRRTIIGGDRQMIVYDDLEPSEKVKVYDRGASLQDHEEESLRRQKIDYRMGDMRAPHIPPSEALQVSTAHFIDCIQNGTVPLTCGQTGLRMVRILEAASESLKRRGELIPVRRS